MMSSAWATPGWMLDLAQRVWQITQGGPAIRLPKGHPRTATMVPDAVLPIILTTVVYGLNLKTADERFQIPFALSEISPAHGARRYQKTGAVLSCLKDFSWWLSP